MNAKKNLCRNLAKIIQNLFSAGFTADTATVHFINSTFDHPGHQALWTILNDTGNCDRDGLIDLVISPDLAVCLEMEALLTGSALTETEVDRLEALLPEAIQAGIRVEGFTEPVFFVVPHACRRRFLSQLNLTRPVPAGVRAAIENHLPHRTDQLTALARMRHARLAPAPPWTTFLVGYIPFFNRLGRSKWFADLNVILDLSCRYNREKDVLAAFAREKGHCLQQVETSLRLTAQLAQNNLETLMMQGNRIGLSADVSQLFQHITVIDEICRLVLGRLPQVEDAGFSGAQAAAFLFEKDRFQ